METKDNHNRGLQNITYEPSKPKPLGTMLQNGVEATTGIMLMQDIVEGADAQPQKDPIMVDDGESYNSLNQQISHKEDGSAVLHGLGQFRVWWNWKNKLGIYSTFNIKQNRQYCPLQVIQKILRARNKDRRCTG